MERFVRRGRDGRICSLDEFQVAKALLAGEAELLSQEVDGKHLFDLCCHFGYQSTAAAMIEHGVSGCVFRGSSRPVAAPDVAKAAPPIPTIPPAKKAPPMFLPATSATPAVAKKAAPAVAKWAPPMLPFAPTAPPVKAQPPRISYGDCNCHCPTTCTSCSWGFSEDDGVWMWDWNASLQAAKEAAESTAAMPVDAALLQAFRSQVASPASVTQEGFAYLLDLAILTGDAELAKSFAKHCSCFPLRRWRVQEFVSIKHGTGPNPFIIEIKEQDILVAALAAGVALQHLVMERFDVPLGELIVFSEGAELWQRVEGLQLQLGPWRKHRDYDDMAFFLQEDSGGKVGLSSERLHRAKRAGLALSSFNMKEQRGFFTCRRCGASYCGMPLEEYSLLDLAILFGQSDCGRLCGAMDIEATEWTLRASLEAMPLVWEDLDPCDRCDSPSSELDIHLNFFAVNSIASLPERLAAAAEALRAALWASLRKTASSAGPGLAMRSWARGRSVPEDVLKSVLTFATGRPSLLQAFEGRMGELPSVGHWWEKSVHGENQDSESAKPDHTSQVQADSLGVTERPPAGAAASSSNGVQAQPEGTSEKESGPDQYTTNDLLMALRNSKSDNPPLSGDGVVIFRLTRKANAEEVNAILFDATGPLWPLHRRVLEAGCEVAPEWSPIKALFVPLTQPQLQELGQGNIYELGKVHLLALQSDAELLTETFNEELQRSVRPKLRRAAPRRDDAEEGAPDHEPLLVMEGGIHDSVRTDSSLGYPVYEA